MSLKNTSIKQLACLAKKGDVKRAKMIAVGFLRGVAIASAVNRRIDGHPTKFTLHAEERLCLKWYRKLDSILVLRVKEKGLGNSKPCKRCMALIRASGIKKVTYWENGRRIVRKVT